MEYKKRLARINELAIKAREHELTKEELQERDILRREYILDFRSSFIAQLDTINIISIEDQLKV